MLRADILSTTLTSGTFTAIENSLIGSFRLYVTIDMWRHRSICARVIVRGGHYTYTDGAMASHVYRHVQSKTLLILLSHKAPSVTHQNSHGESYNYLCCVTFLKGVETCRLLMHNRLHYLQVDEQPGFRHDRLYIMSKYPNSDLWYL